MTKNNENNNIIFNRNVIGCESSVNIGTALEL